MKLFPMLFIAALLSLNSSCSSKKDSAVDAGPKNEIDSTILAYNPGAGWNLFWSDEFNGNTINTDKWAFDIGSGGWGNEELQYYRYENVFVGDGKLTISAKRETYEGSAFTSSRIKTQGKFSMKHGKVAARIKLPKGKGVWPAFWMLGDNITTVGWPRCGEIDILEMRGSEPGTNGNREVLATCHWDDNGRQLSGEFYRDRVDFADSFRIFEVEWDSTKVIARIDGFTFMNQDITAPAKSELRDNNFFLLLNVAVGGNFFSPPITIPANVTATLPQTMTVDWVRAYKK